jgi:hypothetical protein
MRDRRCRAPLAEGPVVRVGERELEAQGGARIGWAVEKDPSAERLDAVFEAD